jgi:hypothetical protein
MIGAIELFGLVLFSLDGFSCFGVDFLELLNLFSFCEVNLVFFDKLFFKMIDIRV